MQVAALFTFFTRVVEQAAARKTVADLLADQGIDVRAAGRVGSLRKDRESLLAGAKKAGAVRDDVGGAEVLALLAATSDAALRSGWNSGLQRRVLDVVFAGLRPLEP